MRIDRKIIPSLVVLICLLAVAAWLRLAPPAFLTGKPARLGLAPPAFLMGKPAAAKHDYTRSTRGGRIIMDDLAAGIMLLPERSSLRLTERQAAKIREIYLLVQAGFRRESFIRLKMSDILTKEQMAFIKKRADEMDPVQFHYAIEVDHAVIRDLRALAGADGSEKPAVVPDSFRPEDVAPHFAFNPVFISNFQEMQRSFPVRMTREQARQALPYVLLYYVNIPAERPPYQILKVLTDEQKDFIDTCHDRIARRGTSHLELIRSFKEFLDARAGAP